jgi:hypothetical protein
LAESEAVDTAAGALFSFFASFAGAGTKFLCLWQFQHSSPLEFARPQSGCGHVHGFGLGAFSLGGFGAFGTADALSTTFSAAAAETLIPDLVCGLTFELRSTEAVGSTTAATTTGAETAAAATPAAGIAAALSFFFDFFGFSSVAGLLFPLAGAEADVPAELDACGLRKLQISQDDNSSGL